MKKTEINKISMVGLLSTAVWVSAQVAFCEETTEPAEPAELTEAKAKTWEAIYLPFDHLKEHCGFYRWKFGEKGHYRPEQIVHVAENIMADQGRDGGWRKNKDLSRMRRWMGRARSTFDNWTTYSHIMYLARVREQTGLTRYDESIRRGIAYTLAAQNPDSGGWRGSDTDAVTFNDAVMQNVMLFLYEVVHDDALYGWLDDGLHAKANTAYDKGLQCILACQVRQDGKLTAWAQQHDHRTLKPSWARHYEPPCITPCESAGVVRMLMGIEEPSDEVIAAIEGAVAWFEAVKINAVQVTVPDPEFKRGIDRLIVEDLDNPVIAANESKGPPIWARMYDTETNEVLIHFRGKKLEKFADLPQERRTGYSFYGIWPKGILEKDYPAWRKRLGLNGSKQQSVISKLNSWY